MYDLLIFDLDGTLIDSAPDLCVAANKVLANHGCRQITLQETKTFVGNGAAKLVERAFRATGQEADPHDIPDLTEQFLAAYDGHEADETRPYDGVMETLNILKSSGQRMAVCTNKPQVPTNNLLRDLKMAEYFELVLGGDQLARKKPDPQMIHWMLDRLDVPAEKALMIGDTVNDIDGAKNAGVQSVAVSYGYRKVPVDELGANVFIDTFEQLLGVIDQ